MSSPSDRLLLAKLATTGEFTFSGWSTTFAEDRRALDDSLLHLAEQGLVVIGEGYDQVTPCALTDAGRAVAATVRPADLPSTGVPVDPAQPALWLWLLTHGVEYTYIASIDAWGTDSEVLHLLRCGIDLTASTPVRDDTWTSFANTFDDEDSGIEQSSTDVGVAGHATCSCGAVAGFHIVAQSASISALLRDLLASPAHERTSR